MIKLRIDVDYPYPSRAKSFLYVALGIKKKSKGYLRNAKVLAQMINESQKQVMAYWFFTPYTIPDKKLLDMLKPDKHEVALHIANDPYGEWKNLEKETSREVKSYTIHGTARLMGQVLWRRKIGQGQAVVPSGFPLKSFHDFNTESLDSVRYYHSLEETVKIAKERITTDYVLSIHPEWLFKRGEKNRRGPYYDALRALLEVDQDLQTIQVRKPAFGKIAYDSQEYQKNINPTEELLEKLRQRNIDVFTFLERKWCCPTLNPQGNWKKQDDNVGLLEVNDYQTWWNDVGKKTRNMVRRAEKSGVTVTVVEPSEPLVEGIWRIYNETPIRQDRAFPHHGESLQTVSANVYGSKKNTFIGAYLGVELTGFVQIIYGEDVAIVSNILSMQKHWDKALNNALLAKTVEVCASRGVRWLMYGRIGNHPSLDRFKESNGFTKFPITRYYVPITGKGRLMLRLGVHLQAKDALPASIKYPLIPVMNWVSRTKVKVKLRLHKQARV